jgi:XisI protein
MGTLNDNSSLTLSATIINLSPLAGSNSSGYIAVLSMSISKDGQIWIQHDTTESGVANDFVAQGVPKADIVLAFHAPYKRPYTGFGVGKEQPGQHAA